MTLKVGEIEWTKPDFTARLIESFDEIQSP